MSKNAPPPQQQQQQQYASSSQNHRGKRMPYYPSLTSGTCLNDTNYPNYYLYDVSLYFFTSAKECCTMHFGKPVNSRGGGMLKAGGVDTCFALLDGSGSSSNSGGGSSYNPTKIRGGYGMMQREEDPSNGMMKSSMMMNPGMKKSGGGSQQHPGMRLPTKPSSMSGSDYGNNGSNPGDSSQHPGMRLPKKPQMPGWSGSVKGDDNGMTYNPLGKKMPPKMYPMKPYDKSATSSMESKTGKSELPASTSSWYPSDGMMMMNPDSKTFKPPPPPPEMKMTPPYMIPPKRPPPPGWNDGMMYYSSNEDVEVATTPYGKSGKGAKSKSSKSKSGKSKAGKSKATYYWDDDTSSPTYMPTTYDAWFDYGNGPNNVVKPENPKPEKPKPDWGGGKPGGGGNTKPGYWWGGQQKPKPEKPKPDWGGGKPGGGVDSKPGYWWGGQQPQPERPKPNWGSWEKPGYGGGNMPDNGSKPGWGSSSKPWGDDWGSWGQPGWGHDGGWNSKPDWGSGWWGGWGGSKKPIESMPSSKPITTSKPTGLFPPETTRPSASPTSQPTSSPTNKLTEGIPTYSPTNPFPTYPPTPSGSTYPPSPSGTYPPTPSGTSYIPTVIGVPTFTPTISPTGDVTPMPTEKYSEVCRWGSNTFSLEDSDAVTTIGPIGYLGIDISSGSKYSFIVKNFGLVEASGYIEDFDKYQGHLGVPLTSLQQVSDFNFH
eukprot:scaffold8889_cov74-Cyclotella_meneghiniana.AAC.4